MQNGSQSPPPHRSSSHISSCVFIAVDELGGVAHNHPSGDPTPSTADIRMTKDIINIAQPFGIVVHDHLIVGRNGHASLKGLKMI